MTASIGLENQLNRLRLVCQEKRRSLVKIIDKNARTKRIVDMCGGTLSLLSAFSLTGVIMNTVPTFAGEIFAIVLATLGGILILFGAFTHKNDSLLHLASGASRYLELREKTNYLQMRLNAIASESALSEYEKLNDKYIELSAIYDQYLHTDYDSFPWDQNITLQELELSTEIYSSSE